MLVVHVHVHVKAECLDAFRQASLEMRPKACRNRRLLVLMSFSKTTIPTRFVLVEVYRTTDDPARHKETAHYARWRDTVADMMADPRSSVKYSNLSPKTAVGRCPMPFEFATATRIVFGGGTRTGWRTRRRRWDAACCW